MTSDLDQWKETPTHVAITRDKGVTLEMWPKAELERRESTALLRIA